MNFRQLEVLVSVIRHSSFSKAAEELFLTQPTVSTHIGSLEEELGVQLVTRGRKTIHPTRAGAVFYEYANGLLKMRDNVLDSMKHYPDLLTSTIEVAASTVPAEYVLPRAVAAFRRDYPSVRFSIRESNSEQVLARLLANEVELGFTGTESRTEKCRFEQIGTDRLVIITPDCEPYRAAVPDQFPAELLETSPFLLRAPGSATQKEADSFLINMGIAPQNLHVAAFMDSIFAIKQSVRNGMGIAILSEIAVKDMEKRGEILVFRNENPFMHRNLYCVYREDVPLSPPGELFLNFIKSRKIK